MTEPHQHHITRGFLFADLRGYTDFVEGHGAAAAAELLTRYRALAREAIGRFGGAEIKTEGDSFYVVFSSVSSAVRCGLAIAGDAKQASTEHPDQPIRVGVGIHAGETVESEGGYVGSPVNIAARICAQAAAGEVWVSETVRALTRTVLPCTFTSRGRRTLKGIAEPVELYSVDAVAEGERAWTPASRPRRPRRRLALLGGGAAAVFVVVAAGAALALRPAAGLPPGDWTIAVDLPLSGLYAEAATPLRNAVQLALDEANQAARLHGVHLALKAHDHASTTGEGAPDPGIAAANAHDIVADPRTIAVIGPYDSEIAHATLPITNAAGLLECGPSATDPALTKPAEGALSGVRAADPARVDFVRLAPSDDRQGEAMADFATHDLHAESALVIDTDRSRFAADQFADAFTALGGRVIRATHVIGTDPAGLLRRPPGEGAADVVYFSDGTPGGAADLRKAMVAADQGDVPLLGWDGMLDGSGTVSGSYLATAGDAAVGTYLSHASFVPPRAAFTDKFRAAFGEVPDEYAGAAYACAQVILDGLQAVSADAPDANGLREALRAAVVDPTRRYETVLGTVGFDENGDSTQQFVSILRVDPAALDGAGDWAVLKQQDFGSG